MHAFSGDLLLEGVRSGTIDDPYRGGTARRSASTAAGYKMARRVFAVTAELDEWGGVARLDET